MTCFCSARSQTFDGAIRSLLVTLALLGTLAGVAGAQPTTSSDSQEDLFQTILSLDGALFASASFEACDLEKFKSFFANDVEFYHDQTGLTVGIETVAQQVEQNLCGKVRRELVSGTLEVFPMHGYGAVQTGVHRFYQPKAGPEPTGEAKFLHLWRYNDGTWKITRVISYDHVGLPRSAR